MKRFTPFIILLVILIGFPILYFGFNVDVSMKDSMFFGALEAIGAILGLFGLIYQEKKAKDLDCARFIVDLNQSYIDDTSHQELIRFLDTHSPTDELPLEIQDIAIQHFDFFEPIYILIQKRIIEFSAIDDLFAFRFFRVVNDKRIQDSIISPNYESYANIILLHKEWSKYRSSKKSSNNIPLFDTDLSLMPWYNK